MKAFVAIPVFFRILQLNVLITLLLVVSVSSLGIPKKVPVNITWPVLDQLFKKNVNTFMPVTNFFKIRKIFSKLALSSSCEESVMDFYKALGQSERWAMHMIDATGKIPSGILDGTVMDFGSFDQCLAIRASVSAGAFGSDKMEEFRGKYCMMGLKSPLASPMTYKTKDGRSYFEAYGQPPNWIREELERSGGFLKFVALWLGTCIPSKCSADDLQKAVQTFVKDLDITVTIADCQIDERHQWSPSEIASVSVLCCLCLLVLTGTFCDVMSRFVSEDDGCRIKKLTTDKNWFMSALTAFSAYGNTEKLLGDDSCHNALSFFDGIRFFSATWIVLGHTYFFTDTWKYLKYRHILGVTELFNGSLPVAVIENFTIPVGSFFFMSGFLMSYTTWIKLERSEGKLNILTFFVHKYFRMTPALVLTIILFLAMPLIDNGPIWNTTLDPPKQLCSDTWWRNLLYINNWWETDNYCLIHTWYLAALMQFHMVASLLLLMTYWCPILGILMGCAIAIVGCVFTALLVTWYEFPMPAPAMIKDLDRIRDYNSYVYIKPFAHVAVYLIGMAVGYIILKYRHVKLRKELNILGWMLAVGCSLASVYGLYGSAETVEIRAVYISLHRIGWALGLAWLTYACATGQGGIVNRILSWRAFYSLGQLSYLAYLLHPLVIIYRTASLREKVYHGHSELVCQFISNTVIGFAMAYVGYIAIELPFATLEGMIFSRKRALRMFKKFRTSTNDIPYAATIGIKPVNDDA